MTLAFSESAERNRQAILDQLVRIVPAQGSVLEIASGTGQHAAHFAASRPDWRWRPTEREATALADIDARCAGVPNAASALVLDVAAPTWPAESMPVDVVFCANMLHIAPWPTCPALMRGSARCLTPQGALVLYGPYIVDGTTTAPGNVAFDADLRSRDARWGVRRLADVTAEAEAAGLALEERIAMPANNLLLVFRRAALAEAGAHG